jgi:hypothetical protein
MAAPAVLIFIVLQPLGAGAASIQEPVQPRIDDEFVKQEKIFQKPSAYKANRGLSAYATLLPAGFCDALSSLGSSDRWLDVGAGEAQAILDYYAPQTNAPTAEKCGGSGPKARAVAVSIEDRRTERWQQEVATVGADRLQYLSGKSLRHYSREELGKFQVISDVYGGFTYTDDLSGFVQRVVALLEVGGAFYTVVPKVHLANGKEKLGTWYKTELVDEDSRPVTVCSWLKKSSCIKVTCESKSDWDEPNELIKIRKVCSDVSVPSLRVVEYKAGTPPDRRFQLEPK